MAALGAALITLAMDEDLAAVIMHYSDGHRNAFHFLSSHSQPQLRPCQSQQDNCPKEKLHIDYREDGVIIVIALLQNAVGIMELKSEVMNLTNTSSYIIPTNENLLDNHVHCNPLDIVSINDFTHTIFCLQSQELFSCELTLNYSVLFESSILCETVYNFWKESYPDFISNFVFYHGGQQILFTNRGFLYGVEYSSQTIMEYPGFNFPTCDRLVFSGDHTILAYSESKKAIQFNLVDHLVTDSWYLNDTGIKFTCDQSNDDFTVKQNLSGTEIVYSHQNFFDTEIMYTHQNFFSNATHFDTGSCIKQPGTSPIFFVVDSVIGLSVLNGSSQTLLRVPNSSNDSVPFHDLFVFPGPYTIILRSGLMEEIIVYDESLQVVMQAEQMRPFSDVALLFDPFQPSTSTLPDYSEDSKLKNDFVISVAVAPVVSIFVIFLLILLLVV